MKQVKTSPFEIRIRLQSYNLVSLNYFKKQLQLVSTNLGCDYSSINLPINKKKVTVLKSPHVNKKARDQYEILFFNHLVILRGLVHIHSICSQLQNIKSEDVSMKFTVSIN